MNTDRAIAVASLVASSAIAVGVFVGGAQIGQVDSEAQAEVDGSLTEAAFVEACFDYQRFVIEQYRAGLSEDQISELVDGALVLQVGPAMEPRDCPVVSEIVALMEEPAGTPGG